MIGYFRKLYMAGAARRAMDKSYTHQRRALRMAGLKEAQLRKMDPDDRVAALEQASLDPYDYIFLAC